MKTGRRIANPQTKQLAGTYRKDRHATITELATPPQNVPVPPKYLTQDALAVWREEHARVVACGVTEADSSLFARYCSMESSFRASVSNGESLSAALLTELRRCAELLGIAGLRSRLVKAPGTDAPAVTSPFTVFKPN